MLGVYHGRESERWWLMRRAATLLLVGPLVMGALIYAVLSIFCHPCRYGP
jgi:hypothetical protein